MSASHQQPAELKVVTVGGARSERSALFRGCALGNPRSVYYYWIEGPELTIVLVATDAAQRVDHPRQDQLADL